MFHKREQSLWWKLNPDDNQDGFGFLSIAAVNDFQNRAYSNRWLLTLAGQRSKGSKFETKEFEYELGPAWNRSNLPQPYLIDESFTSKVRMDYLSKGHIKKQDAWTIICFIIFIIQEIFFVKVSCFRPSPQFRSSVSRVVLKKNGMENRKDRRKTKLHRPWFFFLGYGLSRGKMILSTQKINSIPQIFPSLLYVRYTPTLLHAKFQRINLKVSCWINEWLATHSSDCRLGKPVNQWFTFTSILKVTIEKLVWRTGRV